MKECLLNGCREDQRKKLGLCDGQVPFCITPQEVKVLQFIRIEQVDEKEQGINVRPMNTTLKVIAFMVSSREDYFLIFYKKLFTR